MPNILACIIYEHSLWLVGLAALICAGGCAFFATIVQKLIAEDCPNKRTLTVLGGALMAYAVWATHFVAMIGYRVPSAVGYDPVLTASSGSQLMLVTIVAIWFATSARTASIRGRRAMSGALFGGGVATMHYIGMAGMNMPFGIQWDRGAVALSVVIAVTVGALAFQFVFSNKRSTDKIWGVAALIVAIVGLHFTGMSAITLYSLPAPERYGFEFHNDILAAGVVGLFVVLTSIARMPAFGSNPRKLWRHFAMASVLILTFVTAPFAALIWMKGDSVRVSEAINESGRQRMLSQRIVMYADHLARGETVNADGEPLADILRGDVAVFEQSHSRLIALVDEYKNQQLGRTLTDIYFGEGAENNLHEQSLALVAQARTVLDGDSAAAQGAMSLLWREGSTHLLQGLNRVVAAFEEEAVTTSARFESVEKFSFGLATMVILSQAFLVFLPAHRNITSTLDDLEREKKYAERLSLVAEHATDAVLITDAEGHFEWGNEAFQVASGHDVYVIAGQRVTNIMLEAGADPATIAHIERCMRLGVPVTKDLFLMHGTGEKAWMSVSVSPVHDANGQVRRFILSGRDIRTQKKLEEELTHHRDNLAKTVEERTQTIRNQTIELENALASERELNQLQTEFVSMASHEFRTPLTIMDGVARRIEKRAEKMSPDELKERAGTIRSTIKRMTMLIERTLDASRMSSGRLKLSPDDFGAKKLLSEVCARQQEVAPEHDISIDIDAYPETLFGDGRLMDNVYTNLLSNAVKYSKNNPKVAVRGWEEDGMAVLTVRDFGVGIAKEELPKIFGRFFRAKTSVGIQGTGIGLNLVKNLVDLHHGEVSIDSEEGAWTEITLKLPLESPLREEFAAEDGEAVRTSDGPEDDLALSA